MNKKIQTYGALFNAVQLSNIFNDSKTFPDAVPLRPPDEINEAFRRLLEKFVGENFQLPGEQAEVKIEASASLVEHIDSLWNILEREPDQVTSAESSLIPLPNPYVVPGGRFREIYYWDSYFTCIGLAASGRLDLVKAMIANFAHLIERYGYIPNGNRTYYSSRSQPPFFWKMLQIIEKAEGFEAVRPYLSHLEIEYQYWMGQHHLIRLGNASTLNRYWDPSNLPREESYREDIETFQRALPENQGEIYRNIRAGAESGWDFSSRWLADGQKLESICTAEIIPVDLNTLLYGMEQQLGQWLDQIHAPQANQYTQAALTRKKAINIYCWDETQGWFFDYSWQARKRTPIWSLAGIYPLYCGLANAHQAQKVAQYISERFLQAGGVVTSLHETGQQWDAPNGWSPLQWITVQGLLNYQHSTLAYEIARRFVSLVEKTYIATGRLVEKYDVCDLERKGGGGEYPLQDGFGWTNGVVRVLIEMLTDKPEL